MFFHIASVERQVDFYKNINHLSLGSRYQKIDYQYFGVQGDLLAARKCNLFCLPSSISGHNTFRYFLSIIQIAHFHFLVLGHFSSFSFLPTIYSVIFVFFVSVSMSKSNRWYTTAETGELQTKSALNLIVFGPKLEHLDLIE